MGSLSYENCMFLQLLPALTVVASMLLKSCLGLEKKNVKLVLSNPGPAVVDKLHASKFADLIGEERIFLTVADAVRICSSKLELEP
ncbi:hypothetical protein F3Y22_tig00112206pilonHSYRG00193 [Hibiscus syriacus]|uniref:STAS domain-containing protein n=1 Tax=Hibiscus syriacus TaxID=106335 RepID=A0A6A2XJP3_HIBSY|nr:hypothetical protein F3Y22_tig00112206pilonHSYRG00193 [Hibiscus syriacus]